VTERWRKRLGDLDKQNPSEDLFERAKGGPQLPDEPVSRPSTSTRVVTAVAAFVVFALAISVFAIPALRLKGGSSARGAVGVQLPLWPVRTLEGLQQLQSDADAGKASWALDPQEVAVRFGGTVAGLDPVYTHEESFLLGPTGYYPGFSGSAAALVPGSHDAVNPSSAVSSPYRTFDLNQCAPDSDISQTNCDYAPPGPPNISVVLYQPFGSGVWAVLEARSLYADLSVDPGATVEQGASLTASTEIPSTYRVEFGVHVGDGACSLSRTTSKFQTAGQVSFDGFLASGSDLDLRFDPTSLASCSEEEPGYVYAAVIDDSMAAGSSSSGDPLEGGGPSLFALAAVPITVELGATAPPSSTASGWTTYADSLGWTIDVPSSWLSGSAVPADAKISYEGRWFSDGDVTPGQSPGPTNFPSDPVPTPGHVMLKIWHVEGGPGPSFDDDSSLPLTYERIAAQQTASGYPEAGFRADGLQFGISIRTGDATPPTSEQQQILSRMIASIAFRPWSPGEIRNGLSSIDLPTDPPVAWKEAGVSWVDISKEQGFWSGVYVDGADVVLGPMPNCGDGQSTTASTNPRGPVLGCPGGTTEGWTIDGQPFASNDPGFQDPVAVHPVFTMWDGTLVTSLGLTD
jgi:hypothetical protein